MPFVNRGNMKMSYIRVNQLLLKQFSYFYDYYFLEILCLCYTANVRDPWLELNWGNVIHG